MENWNKAIFVLVFLDRILMMSLVGHWAALGTAALIDRPLTSVLWIAPAVLLLGALVTVVLLVLVNRDGRVSAQMRRGVSGLKGQSVPMILVGFLSNVAGITIFVEGAEKAGVWAIALGAGVMMCELPVLLSFHAPRNGQSGGEAETPTE